MLNVGHTARGAALPAGVLLVGWALSGALYVWMDRNRIHDDQSYRDSIMAGVESKHLDAPDETRTPDKTEVNVVHLGDAQVGRLTFAPGG